MATDSDDAPLKESNVAIDGDDGTATGEDGTTTNNDKKFEFGSKVTITVTKTGYFAMSEEHEFKDSDKTEQEHTIKLAKEGMHYASIITIFISTFCSFLIRLWRDYKLYEARPKFGLDKLQFQVS